MQLQQDIGLQGLHLTGVAVVNMIVAEQMKYTVDNDMCPVSLFCFLLLVRFAVDYGGADHKVTKNRQGLWCDSVKGEAENIGGAGFAAVLLVVSGAFCLIDYAQVEFSCLTFMANCSADPALNTVLIRGVFGWAGHLNVDSQVHLSIWLVVFFMGIIGIYDTLNNRVPNHIAGGKVSEANLFYILQYITGVNQS